MAYVQLPTRVNGVDSNSAADVNQLQDNITDVYTRIGTAEGNITSLDGRLDILEGSFVQSIGSNGVLQNGIPSSDLVFSAVGAPRLDLGVGSWIIFGYSGMKTTDYSDNISLGLAVPGDSSFGCGTSGSSVVGLFHPYSCYGYITISSGTKAVFLFGRRSGGSSVTVGIDTSCNVPCGCLTAYRLK